MTRFSLLTRGALVGALVLSSCTISYAQMPGASKVPVRSAVVASKVDNTTPVTRKKYIGNVEAIEQVDSVARVSGTLTVAPGFEEGSQVKKGQLLFQIDPIPYQAKVDAATAAIAQTEARIDYAQSNYNRLNDLFERNAGSKDDKESAYATLQSLKAELASAKAQLTLAQEDLKYTKIYAEIDGRAGRRAYSSGNYVSPQSSPLIRVVQMDPIYVRFTISERDYLSMFGNLKSLQESSNIELTLPHDEKYTQKGEICFIDNTVKSTTDTIKIWAKFSNPDEILNPGGVVTVNLAKKAGGNVPTVLPSAVMFDGEKNYVYILVDSIDDDTLYKEISEDPRFAKDIAAIENGEKTKEEFLKGFKESRYEYENNDGEKVVELANGKVDEKYLMVLRRDVVLGPSAGTLETVLTGLKSDDVVMMDGVNKARPFDLVKPVFREMTQKSEPAQKNAEKAPETTAQKKAALPATSAKKAAAKKPLACLLSTTTGANA